MLALCALLLLQSTVATDCASETCSAKGPKPAWSLLQLRTSHERQESEATGTLPLSAQTCTAAGCTSLQLSVTLDQNYRWYYHPSDYSNCFQKGFACAEGGNGCSDCVITGDINADAYSRTYGVTVSQDSKSLTLGYPGGTRMYLLDETGKNYFLFQLLGKEFSFDVDVSGLPCGMNGAMYFSEMAKDGGASGGEQGAAYGTGYCDAQCPTDVLTIGGKANVHGLPQCCVEVDIWEANSQATANTLHPCQHLNGSDVVGPYTCVGDECSSQGVCDKYGCDFNAYRFGNKSFFGSGATVDTKKPFTVTTQFVTDSSGHLKEMRRFYTQGGRVYPQPSVTLNGESFDSVSDSYCAAENAAFPGSMFMQRGAMSNIENSLRRGQVLVMSIWNDAATNMLWLDGTTGTGAGDLRGPCGTTDSSSNGNSQVVFSNIKFGDIGTTTKVTKPAGPTKAPRTTVRPSTSKSTTAQATKQSAASNGFCCFAGSSTANFCGTCYSTAIAAPGSFCAGSAEQCSSCGGSTQWCKGVPAVSA